LYSIVLCRETREWVLWMTNHNQNAVKVSAVTVQTTYSHPCTECEQLLQLFELISVCVVNVFVMFTWLFISEYSVFGVVIR